MAAVFKRIPNFMKLTPKASKRLDKLSRPIRSVLTDYTIVGKDILVYAKAKPFRFGSILSLGTLSFVLWIKNPDMNGFVNDVVQYSNDLSQCSRLTRNPSSQLYIENHLLHLSMHKLQYINLGIFSIILRHPNYPQCSNFSETCPQLMPSWLSVWERVVDIGIWNKWINLEKSMTDYDVNLEESFN